uniref:hypothetical protein n=1 Tax=Aeromonas caviae TaxID=648 RepID=UPI003F745146
KSSNRSKQPIAVKPRKRENQVRNDGFNINNLEWCVFVPSDLLAPSLTNRLDKRTKHRFKTGVFDSNSNTNSDLF